MNKVLIAPSLLAADFCNLGRDVDLCVQSGADILHADIMDGVFVPNISYGIPVVEAIRKRVANHCPDISSGGVSCSDTGIPDSSGNGAPHVLPVDCHLMICRTRPVHRKICPCRRQLHIHSRRECKHLHRSLELIRSLGAKAGVALNPATPLEFAYECAALCDFFLLMSVNPGFGGQSFIPSFHGRAERLRNFLIKNDLGDVGIEVDGGITPANAESVVRAGATILVSGSGLFSGNFSENILAMRRSIDLAMK
jgi:ribulose-phosphate 3-epimerase